jgi:hypothetical protein
MVVCSIVNEVFLGSIHCDFPMIGECWLRKPYSVRLSEAKVSDLFSADVEKPKNDRST